MNHFRLFNARPRIETQDFKRTQRNEQLQMTNILQQCKQIMREDKIFIRSKIKEGDGETLMIFRKHRKPADLRMLQITLRKHINAIKAKFKMEQLNKFKENLCELYCGYETSATPSFQKPRKTQADYSRGDSRPLRTLEYSENIPRKSLPSKKRQTRSTSGSKRPANSNLYCTVRPPVIQQAPSDTEVTGRSKSQMSGGKYNRAYSETEERERASMNNTKRDKQLKSERVDTNTFWNDAFSKYVGNRNVLEQEFMKKIEEDSIQEKLENFSVNISETHLDNGQANIRLPTFEGDTYQQLPPYDYDKEKMRDQADGLFTSPQLIQQCKHLLSKSSNHVQSKPDINFNTQNQIKNKGSTLVENTKKAVTAENKPIQINLDEEIQTNIVFDEFAEDIFNSYFPDYKVVKLNRATFQQITNKTYAQPNKFLDLFNLADKDKDGQISSLQLGSTLSAVCKPKPNTARDMFSLIDIDRNGSFSQKDLERFLGQILEQDNTEAKHIIEATNKLFRTADVNGTHRIDYWAFYQTKSMPEFTLFSEFLEQFEFEIQV